MARITIVFAVLLIVLGVAAYALTGMRSWTALIPAIAGVLLLICGLVARDPAKRKHAMHAAVAIAILGFAGSVPGAYKLIQLAGTGERPMTPEQKAEAGVKEDQVMLNNGKVIRPVAAQVQAAMAGILLPYICVCVWSFMNARKARAQTTTP